MKNLVRLQILGKTFYIKAGTEVIVENNEEVMFIPQSGDFVFCDGNKLYGCSRYMAATNTIIASFGDSVNPQEQRVGEMGSDTFLVEEFIAEQENLDPRIAAYLRANPCDLDVNLSDDSPSDITPYSWESLNNTISLIEKEDDLDMFVGSCLGSEFETKFMNFIAQSK